MSRRSPNTKPTEHSNGRYNRKTRYPIIYSPQAAHKPWLAPLSLVPAGFVLVGGDVGNIASLGHANRRMQADFAIVTACGTDPARG